MTETWAIQVKNQRPTNQEFQNLMDASQDWWVFHAMVWKNDRPTPGSRSRWESRVYFRGELYPKRVLPATSDQIQSLTTSVMEDDTNL